MTTDENETDCRVQQTCIAARDGIMRIDRAVNLAGITILLRLHVLVNNLVEKKKRIQTRNSLIRKVREHGRLR